MNKTQPQVLRGISVHIGRKIVLRPMETIENFSLGDDTVMLSTTVYSFKDLVFGQRITGKGTRLYVWKRNSTVEPIHYRHHLIMPGEWYQTDAMTTWDDDFVPFETGVMARTLAERDAQREWENLCYRWGNGSRFGQRDNYARQTQDLPHDPIFLTSESEAYTHV